MLGIWKGYYKHLSKKIPKERRKQETKFTIEITEFNNNIFEGKITEDTKFGGLNGIGLVSGKRKGNDIIFIKQMPIETILVDGKIIETESKHPKLYYKGKYDESKKKFSGKWKFKFGFTKVNGKFAIRMPIKGVWEMEKLKNKT